MGWHAFQTSPMDGLGMRCFFPFCPKTQEEVELQFQALLHLPKLTKPSAPQPIFHETSLSKASRLRLGRRRIGHEEEAAVRSDSSCPSAPASVEDPSAAAEWASP